MSEIDLTKFIAKQPGRYKIDQVFCRGDGWKYATDARYAVRIPSDELKTTFEDGSIFQMPDMSKVFPSDEILRSESIPIDTALFKPISEEYCTVRGIMRRCQYCAGSGRECEPCTECDGEGEVGDECESCGHRKKCKICYGDCVQPIGVEDCCCCDKGTRFGNVKCDDVYLDGSRLKYMMHYLPNLRFISASFLTEKQPVAFTFDGGQAVLMTLTNVPLEQCL